MWITKSIINKMYLPTIYFSAFIFIFFLYKKIWRRRKNENIRFAPEPAGAWPLIGHLPMLFEPNIPHLRLGALADKYGPVFSIRLGLHKAIVVSSWETAKECFTVNDKVFATRPSSVAVKIMGYNYATFGFAPYGAYWRQARKMAILQLLSNHRLESLKHVWISEVNTSIKELYQFWQTKCGCGNTNTAVLVEMKEWFSDLTLNVVVGMVAGKRYFGASAKLEDKEEGKQLQTGVRDFFHLVGLFVLSDAIPSLGWLDFQGHEKAMKRTASNVDSIISRWLEDHRRNILASGGTKVEQDFMYVLLSILEDSNLYDIDADTANKAICWNMILGGADTTTVTLTWALSLLLNHRHILNKAQDEIETTVGKHRQVEALDIEKLVYLQAIVKETLRLYPAVPLSVQHEALEDCTVASYKLPAGTRLITNIWKIQRDPRVWSNPSEFQPERFFTTQANLDVMGQHFELIPFGSGRRSCPGMSFALQVVHLALARLLHSFDFTTPSNVDVDMTESAGLTNLKATPLEVLITPRLPSNLY